MNKTAIVVWDIIAMEPLGQYIHFVSTFYTMPASLASVHQAVQCLCVVASICTDMHRALGSLV